jgi:type IV pilus assembly protein PilA
MKILKKNIIIFNKFKKDRNGFTLIELTIVFLIMAFLATLAFPTLMRQISKSRETDAKTMLGAIGRAQQSYHFENHTFADNMINLSVESDGVSTYYSFSNPSTSTSSLVKHQAIAIHPERDFVKNYAMGIYQYSGVYYMVFCQARQQNQLVDAPDSFLGECTNDGIRIK